MEERRIAVATGVASGMGRAIVAHLAREGAGVIAVDRDEAVRNCAP